VNYIHILCVCVCVRAYLNTHAVLTLDRFIDEGTSCFARKASWCIVLQKSLKRF